METNTNTVEKLTTIDVDDQIEALRDQMAQLNKARMATLPRITVGERNLVCDVEVDISRSETHAKKAAELRKNRQFTEEDRDQIAAARLDHRTLINHEEGKAQAVESVRKAYLHSFKLTHRKDGRVGVSIRGVIG